MTKYPENEKQVAWDKKRRQMSNVRIARKIFWLAILILAETAVYVLFSGNSTSDVPNTIHDTILWFGDIYTAYILGVMVSIYPISKILE